MRGQTCLLSTIVRRNSNGKKESDSDHGAGLDDNEEDKVVMEVVRLKKAQQATEDEIHKMWDRLHDAERKPKQMLDFLARVLKNPALLDRLMAHRAGDEIEEKRVRLRINNETNHDDDGSVRCDDGSVLNLDRDDDVGFCGGPEPMVYDFGMEVGGEGYPLSF